MSRCVLLDQCRIGIAIGIKLLCIKMGRTTEMCNKLWLLFSNTIFSIITPYRINNNCEHHIVEYLNSQECKITGKLFAQLVFIRYQISCASRFFLGVIWITIFYINHRWWPMNQSLLPLTIVLHGTLSPAPFYRRGCGLNCQSFRVSCVCLTLYHYSYEGCTNIVHRCNNMLLTCYHYCQGGHTDIRIFQASIGMRIDYNYNMYYIIVSFELQ